jgi:hypothetical protein
MLKNYIRIARRNILRHKAFTIINILGLTLGVCSCIVIFLISHYELSFDRFHPDKERIYHIGNTQLVGTPNERKDSRVLPPVANALKQEIPGIEAAASFFNYYPSIAVRGDDNRLHSFENTIAGSDQSSVIITGPEYFAIFKYDWLAGSPSGSLQKPFSVVLSANRARQYFGALPIDQIIGKEVIYNDSLRVSVSGIVKDWKENTDFPFTEFISWNTIGASFLHNEFHTDMWGPRKGAPGPGVWAMIKLSKNTTPAKIIPQLEPFAKRHWTGRPESRPHFQLQSLSDIHFNTAYDRDGIRKAHLPTLYILMGVALFILLLAVINFINLSTAQSIQRSKEVGVRKVLGSSRLHLVFQFLAETAIVSGFAILLAALLVRPLLSFFRDFIPPGVVFHPFGGENLVFLLLLLLGTTVLAGLYPAIGLSSYSPVLSLKGEGGPRGDEKWWLRKGLIVFQFSISLVFIIGTLVIGRQIRYMLHSDFGFKSDTVMAINNAGGSVSKLRVLKEKIRQLPGVENVVLQGYVPVLAGGYPSVSVTLLGKSPVMLQPDVDWANDEYIPFYGMKMLAGRNIIRSDSLREFVINEACMRALGFTDPEKALGQFLQVPELGKFPIVGVVADFHQRSFHDPIAPLLIGYVPDLEWSLGVRLSSAGKDVPTIHATLTEMSKIWKEVYPDREFEYGFIDEEIANFYQTEERTSKLVRMAMLITVFISCLGLFGLVLFTAHRKTKEIGIRKVIGASVADIVRLLCKDFVLLICIATAVASPIAWWLLNRWLEGFAYRLAISWWIFVLAGVTAMVIALLTVSFQAIKAARANPIKSLRTE